MFGSISTIFYKREEFLIMFKKALTGFTAVVAVTGSLAAMAPAQAQSILKTMKAADIAKQENSAAQAKIEPAQRALNSANSTANRAKTTYESSKAAETRAKQNYDTAKAAADAAKTVLDNAQRVLQAAQSTLAQATTATQRRTAQDNLNRATNSYNSANDAYGRASRTANNNLQTYQTAVSKAASDFNLYQTAQTAADTALKTLQNAQQTAQKASETVKTTATAAESAWGNWSKTLKVQDRSADKSGFQSIIPMFQQLVQKERVAIPGDKIAAQLLDPNKLFLKQGHDVRVWFLNEGAGYRNQLAYEATKGTRYEKAMIFNDVSCDSNKNRCELGEKDGVLDIGDFVDLGRFEANSQFNFLIKADGASAKPKNGDIYGGDAALNPDGLQHLMAWQVGNYLMLGFEDLRGGGDKDYNDVMFIVDFGKGNLKTTAVPEPGTMAALLGVTGAGMWMRRRKKQASA